MMVQGCGSDDRTVQLEATTQFRKLLSIGARCPYELTLGFCLHCAASARCPYELTLGSCLHGAATVLSGF